MPDDLPAPTEADPVAGPGGEALKEAAPAADEALKEAPTEAPAVVDDGEIRDELPADLDVTGLVGPYVFPDNGRRRIQAVIHLVVAAVLVALWAAFRGDGVLVNDGYLVVAGILVAVAAYSAASARRLQVRELDALAAAAREVGFPVGHASAQMAWRSVLSIPTWRVLVFSADDPPTKRGLVVVDGISGDILGSAVEDNPEDWSDFD